MGAPAFGFDAAQVRRAFRRAARGDANAAVLEREVERRMLERLEFIRCDPRRILDAGCGAGRGMELLRRRYPKANLLGVDLAPAPASARATPLLERARRLLRRPERHRLCADFSRLPIRAGSVDMVWSNLALAWAADPMEPLREFHRVLAVDGLLMFSSYGPDTLKELKSAFAAAVPGTRHVHAFVDMHDLGDMLVASGFTAPVMDMEMITLTYADVAALARDLRASGQTCAARDRRRSLTGRGAWQRMLAAYERERRDGRLPATVEVVYGHAWKAEARMRPDGSQVVKVQMRTKIKS
jgi:malonyl-CoA O-methyltransferase